MGLQGGVGEPEHAIAEGGVGGDDLFELAQVGGSALELGEQVEIDEVVRGERLRDATKTVWEKK